MSGRAMWTKYSDTMHVCSFDKNVLLISGLGHLVFVNLADTIIKLIILFFAEELFCWFINKNNVSQLLSSDKNNVSESDIFIIKHYEFKLILIKDSNDENIKLCIKCKYPRHLYSNGYRNITFFMKLCCKEIDFTYKQCMKLRRRKSFKIIDDNIDIAEKYAPLIFECYIDILWFNTIYSTEGFGGYYDSLLLNKNPINTKNPNWYNKHPVINYEWNLNNNIINKLEFESDVQYFSHNFGDEYECCLCLYLIKQQKKQNWIKLGLRILKLPLSVYCIRDFQCLFQIQQFAKQSHQRITRKQVLKTRFIYGSHDICWKKMCAVSDILYWLRTFQKVSFKVTININQIYSM